MTSPSTPTLDAEKLYDNALISIQLGIEDFELSISTLPSGNQARALSSVRNLFAGMLLLFKYKIAASVNDPADAYTIIFNPPTIVPESDGNGGVRWVPDGNFKKTTIDVQGIQQRFEGFGIDVDWNIIKKLQDCRNHLEHLHPKHTYGEVAGFVAALFPVLSDFITNELQEIPSDVLGGAWDKMLDHKDFYNAKLAECDDSWQSAGIPIGMQTYLDNCNCQMCGSKLIMPEKADLDSGFTVVDNEDEFRYRCMSCGHADNIAPELYHSFHVANYHDPRDGSEPIYETCQQCNHDTFLIFEQKCAWCDATLEHNECKVCGEPLTQDEQYNGGLCSADQHISEKRMRKD
ncbi:acetone carboxylase subunit gamma [Pectobacterium brasiliense]|uniref:acetone carboxylase subunit gamma n=1 Tax=Pectobacterium brasiliense TaxID=180957 RepID=UPI0032ED27BC